jgi:hypothetical protein
MSIRVKYVLVLFTGMILLLPLLQFCFNFIESKPLDGDAVSTAQKPELSSESYWDLSWQDNYSRFFNDNFGFRTDYIRFINQLRYCLFNESTARSVVVGKQGEFFTESYIKDYIGASYVGTEKIVNNVTKIKQLQDSLSARGKDLIVVFAPGKASYYPELIPDRYMNKKKDSTNYTVYASQFIKHKVNFIDLNKWFYEQKTKFKHPVYPKYGAHWNHYGMNLGLDSIIKYIEKLRNINLPDYNFTDHIEYSDELTGHDFDIGILLNLMVPVKKDKNPYPKYTFATSGNFTKPSVLTVGDSYWWCMLDDNLPGHFFADDEFWFYNEDVVRNTQKTGEKAKKVNYSSCIVQKDVVLLVATEATFYLFPYGFIDSAYDLYCKDHSKRIHSLKKEMAQNPEWYAKVSADAVKNNVSMDQQMKQEAEYIIYDDMLHPVETIEQLVAKIKADPTWMEDIKKKAQKNHISVEEQINADAIWMHDQQKKK